MNRHLFASLLLVAALPTAAQSPLLPVDSVVDLDRGWGHLITISGTLDYNANTVYNELPLAIYRGGYIDRDLRERSRNALHEGRNSVGYVLEGRINWTTPACLPKHPGWRPIFSLAHHELGGLRFTKDQYSLTFFGNAEFEDRKAVFAPSTYEQVRYQTLGAGLFHERTRSYARLDLVRGQSYTQADIRWASLFTGEDGRVLRTAFLGDYHASDTAGSGLDRANGLGLAVTGRWNMHFKISGRTVDIGTNIEDFGLLRWSANSVRIQQDTLINYSGWAVDNIFALDNVIVGEEELLDTLGLRYKHGSFTRLLPFRASIDATMPVGGTWRIGLGLEQRYLPGYVPQLSVMSSCRIGTRTSIVAAATYGGFGALRMGVAAKRRFGERVLLSIATPHLPGLVTGMTRGLGVVASIEFGF